MAEFKKINPKNIKDIDGICTLTDITTSEEVAEFYNSYVVPNNKQKYAAISKNGIVYKYDPAAKKHVKIGVQNANGPRVYAENTSFTNTTKEVKPVQQAKPVIKEEVQKPKQVVETPIKQEVKKDIEYTMDKCIEYLTSLGYTVSLTKNKE